MLSLIADIQFLYTDHEDVLSALHQEDVLIALHHDDVVLDRAAATHSASHLAAEEADEFEGDYG